jgi:hypothetical protein
MKATLSLAVPFAVASIFGGVLYVENARDIAPASDWLSVKSIVVHPSFEGRAPVMTVEREIRKRFIGQWSATVRQSTPDGFTIACASSGWTEYQPDATLPKPLTLDWWTGPVECNLKAGTYRLDTIWTINAKGFPPKHVNVRSNLFVVKDKE